MNARRIAQPDMARVALLDEQCAKLLAGKVVPLNKAVLAFIWQSARQALPDECAERIAERLRNLKYDHKNARRMLQKFRTKKVGSA